jgi:hypothetical protein
LLLEPDPMFGHGPLPFGIELDFGAGAVFVCGVVGVVVVGVVVVEVVVDGEVLVAADAPAMPAAAPPVASAPATSVAPIIFEMRMLAPSCLGDKTEGPSSRALLSRTSGWP